MNPNPLNLYFWSIYKFIGVTIRTLPYFKCIRLFSVRSSRLPF